MEDNVKIMNSFQDIVHKNQIDYNDTNYNFEDKSIKKKNKINRNYLIYNHAIITFIFIYSLYNIKCSNNNLLNNNNFTYNVSKSELISNNSEVYCTKEKPFQIILTKECVEYCEISELKNNICILKFENSELEEDNINNNIASQRFDKELENTGIIINFIRNNNDNIDNDELKEDVIKVDKMNITFTTKTKNNKTNDTNDLPNNIIIGDCEAKLRKFYNISNDKILFIKKNDSFYDFYVKLNNSQLTKLNSSMCSNSSIKLVIPFNITDDLFKYNFSSSYYNDICLSDSDSCGDITLSKRRDSFFQNNYSTCPDNCFFSDYDYNSSEAICSCKGEDIFRAHEEEKKDIFKKIKKSFLNLELFKCYKHFFKKESLSSNIGFFTIIFIIFFHIISTFVFYIIQNNKIKNKIQDIIFGINNIDLLPKKKVRKYRKKHKKKNNFIETNVINDKNNEIPNEKNISKKENNKDNPPIKKRRNNKIHCINVNKTTNMKINGNIIVNKKEDKTDEEIKSNCNKTNLKKNDEIIRKVKDIMDFTDDEINDLDFKQAINYDKRTYFKYYFSLLKTKHSLIFAFFYNKDYNAQIIKIDLFVFNFVISYTINAFFYNDKTIEQLYNGCGKYDIQYRINNIIFSSLISILLNLILKILALSNDAIIKFKKDKSKKDIRQRDESLKLKLKIKFIFFFMIGFIFLFIFLFYLSMFSIMYKASQYYLIKDTLVSFGLSLVYPFGIYLFPGFFRIPALKNPKRKRVYLYKICKILQML